MPLRKRRNRRKLAAAEEEWETVFASEFDFFGELADTGVAVDEYGRPDREEAPAAWRRFGTEFLAGFNSGYVPWALTEFGYPRASKT